MVEPAFRVRLTTDTAIQGIVGDRVYFNVRAEDETRPCLVLQRVSTFFARRFGGDFGTIKGRVQVDCFAADYQTVKTLAAAVRARLDKFQGTVEGIKFFWLEIEDERDVPAAPLKGQATPLFGVSVDSRFMYEES